MPSIVIAYIPENNDTTSYFRSAANSGVARNFVWGLPIEPRGKALVGVPGGGGGGEAPEVDDFFTFMCASAVWVYINQIS